MVSYLSSKSKSSRKELNWRKSLLRLEGAYAESTIRAYQADVAAFENWCRRHKKPFLPSNPKTIGAYIGSECNSCATSTLKRRLSGIRKVHRLLKLESPVADEEVLLAMRRVMRTKLTRPKQALGLTKDLRDRLIKACPNTLSGKRDRALIAVGYDTLCRRSELVFLRAEDLEVLENNTARILIARAKNDPFGQGRLGYLSSRSTKVLTSWMKAAKITKGFLFREVRGNKIGQTHLHPYSVNRILKQSANRAGLPDEKIKMLSGHSMRVGAAQDMIKSGLSILPIMQAGGWKTMSVVSRYVEKANLSSLIENMRRNDANSFCSHYQ